MSSAVNKSQKRFMPKVSSRGPSGRAPARRLSTLRTSFSVNKNTDHAASSRKVFTSEPETPDRSRDGAALSSSRAQMLGLTPESLQSAPETAVEEDSGPSLQAGPQGLRDQQPIAPKTARSSSSQLPRLPKPASNSRVGQQQLEQPASAPRMAPKPAAAAVPIRPKGGLLVTEEVEITPENPVHTAAEQKPEAPPGCEVIWPEDLPELRASERKRKIALEKEFVALMRTLYAEREKTRIEENSDEIIEDSQLEAMAHEAAMRATYHQLKQAVGNEAKAHRNNQPEGDKEHDSKTVLDVNKFTMASLCRDIPVGDRNENYDDYELARINRRRDTVRVFRAKMWSRNMYEPREEERNALKEAFKKYQEERKERSGKLRSEQKEKFTAIDDATTDSAAGSHPQASIEISANGDISLVGTQFDRHKNNRAQKDGAPGAKTEVDRTEQVINSYSFSTRERPDRWTPDETAKFYEAISALGTDFNLIAHLFPMRSRNQIKTKFKYEEKRNPTKLQMYMVSKRKFNLDSYAQVSNVPIEEVDSIEGELEKVRREHAEQMKLEEASRLRAKEEDQKSTTSKRSRSSDAHAKNPKRERVE